MNKEIKVTITISVDKTELDEAIKEMERLHELQGKVNKPSASSISCQFEKFVLLATYKSHSASGISSRL